MKSIGTLVPTLEQCKALAPYWGDRESVFVWQLEHGSKRDYKIRTREFATKTSSREIYPAPTMQELWEALPNKHCKGYKTLSVINSGSEFFYEYDSGFSPIATWITTLGNPQTEIDYLVNSFIQIEAGKQ